GADIVAALALGADFTLIGRAYLYGLMAGGREGVDRAIAILAEEIERTMKLLQVTNVEELTPAHVTQLERLTRRTIETSSHAAVTAQKVRAPRAPIGRCPYINAATSAAVIRRPSDMYGSPVAGSVSSCTVSSICGGPLAVRSAITADIDTSRAC